MSNFFAIAEGVLPVFLLVLLGIYIKHRGVIDDHFVRIASKVVFNYSLPAFIFLGIANADVSTEFSVSVGIFGSVGTLICFAISWGVGYALGKTPAEIAALIQGSFRSNYAIVGFAIITNLYGVEAIAKPSLLMIFVLPLFNLLSVIALTFPFHGFNAKGVKNSLKEVAVNPMVVSVVFAIPFSYFRIEIPRVFVLSGEYMARVALPLALIGIGGALNFTYIKESFYKAFVASMLKIVVFPLITVVPAIYMGYTGIDLITILIIFGTPTAIASFIMAQIMGADEKLSGNIILLSTLGSVVTVTLGLYILTALGKI